MNKTYKLSALWMMCLMLFSCLSFTACDNGDDENTNQYGGGVKLNVFGPCPVARGGELRFLGSGMDQITSIILPGSGEITEIKKISNTEIHITVPQNAEEGLVTLKWAKGEIITKTPVTYSEPIALEDFTPKSVKAGDVITITGEYLNLIKEVIFADGVAVTEFVSHSRKEIKVITPVEAQTGKIIISDGAEIPNWIYSDEELVVTLPTITTIAPNPLKVGQALTITGTDFDLVEKVVLPGGEEIILDELADNTEIVIDPVPVTTKEGAIVLVAKSGVEVSSEELELIKPTVTGVSSTTVKNGALFTITGTNLDLVSKVSFPVQSNDPDNPAYVVVEEFIAQTGTSLSFSLPETAVDGAFVLGTASETETVGESLTFAKPEVTALSATSIKAGENLILTGTNLDVVASVRFGEIEGIIVTTSESGLTVTVPVGAESGPLTLVMESKVEIETTQTITINVTLPVINSITGDWSTKKITVEGTNLSILKTIYFIDENGDYTIKVTDYGMKTDTKVEFYFVDGAAAGFITPQMETFDGDKGFMPKVYMGGTDPIVDPSLMIFDFDNGLAADAGLWDDVGGKGDVSDGISGEYYEIKASNWNDSYWWFAENYLTHPSVTKADHVVKMDIRLRNDVPVQSAEVRFMISGKAVNFLPYLEKGSVWSTGGEWTTITIPLTEWTDLSDPTPETAGEWGIATWINGANFTGFCIDNIRYEKIN